MKRCLVVSLFILGSLQVVYGGINLGEVVDGAGEGLRENLVKMVDGDSGVKCKQYDKDDNKCPKSEITYWLYTKDTRNNPHKLDPLDENTIRNAGFVRGQPLKILVHGYTMNRDTSINDELRRAYFDKNYNYNIISVDWSPMCPEHCYNPAAASVPAVGRCVGTFIKRLEELHPGTFSQVHLLGHSMGAHVTSYAAALDGIRLDRLTQFDPALPLFSNNDDLFKRPDGPFYIDVWHSNCNLKGRRDPSGKADIYFNDEANQPGCKCDQSCSHLRAVQYYAETVKGRGSLTAFRCGGWDRYNDGKCGEDSANPQDLTDFGETATTAEGSYLAFTNDRPPFIIEGYEYTNTERFPQFKEWHKQSCTSNRVQAAGIGAITNIGE